MYYCATKGVTPPDRLATTIRQQILQSHEFDFPDLAGKQNLFLRVSPDAQSVYWSPLAPQSLL